MFLLKGLANPSGMMRNVYINREIKSQMTLVTFEVCLFVLFCFALMRLGASAGLG